MLAYQREQLDIPGTGFPEAPWRERPDAAPGSPVVVRGWDRNTLLEETAAREVADAVWNREKLRQWNTLTISLWGTPRSGKTALLEQTLRRIGNDVRSGVVVVGPNAARDIKRLRALTPHAVAVEASEIDSTSLRDLMETIHPDEIDLLLIEESAPFERTIPDLGQDARVGMFSVEPGTCDLHGYPRCTTDSDLLLLNKVDLLAGMNQRSAELWTRLRYMNPYAPLIEMSVLDGSGVEQWDRWLQGRLSDRALVGLHPASERYVG